jgi:Holliday junction resolvase
MANRNRTAGHNWEREVIKDLKKAGFTEAVSARYESKRLDDAGVDIVNTSPFNMQCKNEAKRPDYHKLIQEMPDGINIVLHKFTQKIGEKFIVQGKYAIIEYNHFIDLMEVFISNRKKK